MKHHIQTIVNKPSKGDTFKQTIRFIENGVERKITIPHFKKGGLKARFK